MGFVTVEASSLINERPVNSILAKGLVEHIAMTAPAEFKSCAFRLEGRGRCRLLVALAASLAGHRRMHRVEQDTGRAGSMRSVTRDAVRFGHRVIDVLPSEALAVRLVASNAQFRYWPLEQMSRFLPRVRVMAIEASTLYRVVLELDLRQRVADGLVATQTEFVSGLKQIALGVGSMGIVTLHAISFDNDLVGAYGLVGDDLVMAREADSTPRCIQKLSMSAGVRIMASGTLGFLHGGVNKPALQLFFELRVTIQAELSLGPRLQLELVLPVRNRNS